MTCSAFEVVYEFVYVNVLEFVFVAGGLVYELVYELGSRDA